MESDIDLQHYDIISNLDNIKIQTTIKYLLAIACHCMS